ncbi:RNA polymerase sigma factor (plasmid) [Paroceanicella profunda]|uniref:RNA polymerase sigma factor n=2 Tax=Paroceanicella profunda TaxID=2579971 RepID=A0A5B8FJ52_9RHOB|nr:RNA polymerase sigma factor [Paroceanicella profunda]
MQELLEPQIPALRRYARALLRDATAADDLVQDCLERAVGRWHQRRPDGSPRAWVYAILHNLAMNRMRQAGRRGLHVAVEDTDHPALAQRATQEDGLRRDDVLRALDALPEAQRSVILLVSVEGMRYAEVAKALDLPLGTVMSRLARGRERLRELLAQREAEGRPVRRGELRSVK